MDDKPTRRGKPRKIGLHIVNEALIKSGGCIVSAVEWIENELGIPCPFSVIESYIQDNPDLQQLVKSRRLAVSSLAEKNIADLIKDGNYRASVRWLEKYGGWGRDKLSDDSKRTETQMPSHIVFVDPPQRDD